VEKRNIREHRRCNKKLIIQRNWQHKTKKNKVKTQHNMCRTQLCTKNTTQHVSDTTINHLTQHNMCLTQLSTKNTTQHVSDTTLHKKYNTTCVGHNFAQKTQHNMCRTQLYTNKHNTTCVGHRYTPTNTSNVGKT
jgi:hypothetical protein